MNNPRFRMAATSICSVQRREKRKEKFPRFFPRNPLISLDSDEEIQGNPIAGNWGFRGETAWAKKIQMN
jgi:hypothetical protein